MPELKDYLDSIYLTKKDLSEEDPDACKKYPAFIINKCCSAHIDCIMFANEMNLHHQLDKDMQYSFYLNTLRKKKRFSPWLRKDKVKNLDVVKSYYGYSNEKAMQALKILDNSQLDYIKNKLDVGGTR